MSSRLTTFATLVATVVAVSALNLSQAQERISKDEASRYANLVGEAQKSLKDAPIATEVDVTRPVALRDGEYGAMVLPDKRLAADALAKVGTDVLPLGQLWLHKLAPLVDGAVVPNSKLKTISPSGGELTASTVPCLFLGVRKSGDNLELVIYGKAKEPIQTAKFKAISLTQELPIELDATRENDGGLLKIRVLGKFEAEFKVTDPDQY